MLPEGLEEQGLSVEDGELTLSRKITAGGKNIFRLNGETVSASVVKELAAGLIDVPSGQLVNLVQRLAD